MLWLLLAACGTSGESTTPTSNACAPAALDWSHPVTTLTERVLADPPIATPLDQDPAFAEGLAAAVDLGLGGASVGPGEPHLLREDLAPKGAATERRSLTLFLHHSDAQLADSESPNRVAGLDLPGLTQAAARPQELYAIHALDALIRTANAISETAPIDFAIATGDNADSAQQNESTWFRDTWDGTPVRPDSGTDDQQQDEDCNDPIDEFDPVGADFPWYAVVGNHDVLVQGNFDIQSFVEAALGTTAVNGTRDLSLPGGPLTYVSKAADPARKLLDRQGLVEQYLDTPSVPGPVGHGFTQANYDAGTVEWSTHPVAGVPLRLIGLDTNPDSPANGELTAASRDNFLIPELEAAAAAGELVVLASHYALGRIDVEGGGPLSDLLVQYPNVVLSVVGHSHTNRITPYAGTNGGFWEIETSSSVDWPGQARFVELVDNGDGTLSILATLFDPMAPTGSMVARGRWLSLIDWQSGWLSGDGTGLPEDRNVELIVPVPAGVTPSGGVAGVRSELLP